MSRAACTYCTDRSPSYGNPCSTGRPHRCHLRRKHRILRIQTQSQDGTYLTPSAIFCDSKWEGLILPKAMQWLLYLGGRVEIFIDECRGAISFLGAKTNSTAVIQKIWKISEGSKLIISNTQYPSMGGKIL